MIAVLQRVSEAWVSVNGSNIARIEQGMMVLIGVQQSDTPDSAFKMAKKLTSYRIFADEQGKMNLSVKQISGSLLLVPQFTLAAQTNKGMRPGFSSAAAPEKGKEIFESFVEQCTKQHRSTQSGLFGADMEVGLINDGPVTFIFDIT